MFSCTFNAGNPCGQSKRCWRAIKPVRIAIFCLTPIICYRVLIMKDNGRTTIYRRNQGLVILTCAWRGIKKFRAPIHLPQKISILVYRVKQCPVPLSAYMVIQQTAMQHTCALSIIFLVIIVTGNTVINELTISYRFY